MRWVAIMAVALVLAMGCTSTVTPRRIVDRTASFDGNAQDSGFLGWTKDGFGIISERKRATYNELIARYSDRFAPRLKADDGVMEWLIIGGRQTYRIDKEHLVKFIEMTQWRKEGK